MSKNISFGIRITKKDFGKPDYLKGRSPISKSEFNQLVAQGYTIVPSAYLRPFTPEEEKEHLLEPEITQKPKEFVIEQLPGQSVEDYEAVMQAIGQTPKTYDNTISVCEQIKAVPTVIVVEPVVCVEEKENIAQIPTIEVVEEVVEEIPQDNIAEPEPTEIVGEDIAQKSNIEPTNIVPMETPVDIAMKEFGSKTEESICDEQEDECEDNMPNTVEVHEQEREKLHNFQLIKRDGWRPIRPSRGYTYLVNDGDKPKPREHVLSENEPINSGIIVRDETNLDKVQYRRIESVDEYYKMYTLPNKTHFVHEVINGRNPYKPVFDIDVDAGLMDEAAGIKLVNDIIERIKNLFEREDRYKLDYEQLEYIVCDSSGMDGDKYKPSYHIIFPYLLFPNCAEGFAFTEELQSEDACCKYIDINVNSRTHNLRILGSTKKGRTKKINYELSVGKFWGLEHTLISQTIGATVLPNVYNTSKEDSKRDSSNFSDENVKFMNDWLIGQYEGKVVYKPSSMKGRFDRIMPAHCFQCGRTHTSKGARFVMWPNGKILFKCWAAKGEGGWITVREGNTGPEKGKKRALMKVTGDLSLTVDCLRTFKIKWHRKCFGLTKPQLEAAMCKDLGKIAKYMNATGGGTVIMIEEVGVAPSRTDITKALVNGARIFSFDKWGTKVGMDEIYNALLEVQHYSSIIFRPNPLSNKNELIGPYAINRWNSWAPVPVPSDELDLTKCQPMLDHMKEVICSGDLGLYEYEKQYWASVFQGEHLKVATILYSKSQGVGKNLFTDYLSAIFGEHSTVATLDQFAGRFNEQYADKSLIVIDELSQKSPSDKGSTLAKLKRFITANKMSYEPKGQTIFTSDNMAHLVFTTNWTGNIQIEDTDRRYNLIECSDKYVGNEAYFNELAKHVMDPAIARESQAHFLRYMLDMPITLNVNKPYVTELKNDMQRIYNSPDPVIDFVKFVKIEDHLVVYKDGDVLIAPQELFDIFVKVFGTQDGTSGHKMTKGQLTQKLLNYRGYTNDRADAYALESKSVRFGPHDVRRCIRLNPKYIVPGSGTKNMNGHM